MTLDNLIVSRDKASRHLRSPNAIYQGKITSVRDDGRVHVRIHSLGLSVGPIMPINTTPLNVLSKGDTVVCTFTDETNTNLVILGSATKKNDIYASADNGISIYTNNVARDAGVPSPSEGRVIYLLDTDELQIYNGTEWITVIDTGNSENITASTLVATSASIGTLTVTGPSTLTVLGSSNLSSSTTIGTITPTEIGHLDGVTSGIQAQINLKAPSASPTFTGTVVLPDGTVTSSMILDGTIVNADINSAAAIAYSKLNLATSIVNGDISASAAIALSKLATTGTITATTFVGALTGTASGNLVSGGALGTPSSGNLTNCTFPTVPNATSAGNANTVGSLGVHSGRNNEANKVVRTQENGYILCGYINSSNGNEGNNSSPPRVWGTNGSDDYLRSYLTSALNVNSANSAGNSNTVGGFTPQTSGFNGGVAIRYSGDARLDSNYFVGYGTVSVGAGASTSLRRRTADGYFLIDGSRLKYKENVETVSTEDAINLIKNLRPVKFHWKKEFQGPDASNPLLNEIRDTNKEYGFIAEEVHQVSPELVSYLDDNEDGIPDPIMWQQNAVISILVKTVQDLVSRIEHLESNGAN
jgi:uncharacterized protein YunC (DUF1805 family)